MVCLRCGALVGLTALPTPSSDICVRRLLWLAIGVARRRSRRKIRPEDTMELPSPALAPRASPGPSDFRAQLAPAYAGSTWTHAQRTQRGSRSTCNAPRAAFSTIPSSEGAYTRSLGLARCGRRSRAGAASRASPQRLLPYSRGDIRAPADVLVRYRRQWLGSRARGSLYT